MDMTPSLVARLRAGDREAGELLEGLYRRAIWRFCRGYLDQDADAEDATQEVFCRVLAAREIPENFRAWLYKIARNHCRNLRRDRARRRDAAALPPGSRVREDRTGVLTRLTEQERWARLGHLIAALPAAYREALRLRHVEELSRSEIAYVLDIPESVVKSRLFQGVKRLGEHKSLLGA